MITFMKRFSYLVLLASVSLSALGREDSRVQTYITKSKDYASQQRWVLSQQQAMLALTEMERGDVYTTSPQVHSLIAESSVHLGKDDMVVAYGKAALDDYQRLGDQQNAFRVLIMIIDAYLRMGEVSQAEGMLDELRDLSGAITDPALRIEGELAHVNIAFHQANFAKAGALLNELAHTYGDDQLPFAYCYLHIHVQLKLGKAKQALIYIENFNRTLPKQDRIVLSEKEGLMWMKLHIKALEANGIWGDALTLLKQYKEKSFEYLNTRNETIAEGVTAKYELDKKAEINRMLSNKNERAKLELKISEERRAMQTIVVYLSGGLALLIVIICIAQFFRRRALHQVVNFDSLTGIPNRHALMRNGKNLLKSGQNYPFSVILFDVDNFKTINDSYGHETGDHVLVDIARIGMRMTPHGQWFARLGGEEFVMLLAETDAQDAIRVAEEVLDEMKAHDWTRFGLKKPVTASLGVTTATEFYMGDLDKLLVRADKAMYQAKKDGRAKVRFLDAMPAE